MKKPVAAITAICLLFAALGGAAIYKRLAKSSSDAELKLYWFIPDGLRAEPDTFQIYQWAKDGTLPNLKRMMENGSYGYSIPTFPGHTPINFATLLTGATPAIHGVADGPIHLQGFPLRMASISGFSSTAKKVPPLPYTLEERGYSVAVLSVPGTTPPELTRGTTLRGRWGGWGIDFPAVIFQSAGEGPAAPNYENRVFYSGPELMHTGRAAAARGWEAIAPRSFSPAQELKLTNWGLSLFAYVYDSKDDGKEDYDRVMFSLDKKSVFADLNTDAYSEWLAADLSYEMQNDYNIQTPKKKEWERGLSAVHVPTHLKIKVIKLGTKGFYRIRFFYDSLNEFSVQPSHWAAILEKQLGPMVDFPDSYPAQLIHYDEDKATFLEESALSFAWHKGLAGVAASTMGHNAVIQNIYSPNQMLTSRWWMGFVDPKSARFNEKSASERDALMAEVKEMYRKVDLILGEILDHAGPNAIVVFSSDHGVIPLDKEVRLNNLFAREGLLVYSFNKKTETFDVNWERSRAVFLKMDGIYLNPNGLGGNYQRAQGPEYEKLRDKVIGLVEGLKDADGTAPLEKIVKWENARELQLPSDRVGDLVVANRPGFNWSETLSQDHEVFADSLVTGYKQAVLGEENRGMWTPFVIMGPGVRKNHALPQPIHHIEQYPTIMKLLHEPLPDFVEGKPLAEIEN